MSDVVILDSGPLGFLTNPNPSPVPVAIRQWLTNLVLAGRRVMVPEIADYEIRREYLGAKLVAALSLLDSLPSQITNLPLTTSSMRRAAE